LFLTFIFETLKLKMDKDIDNIEGDGFLFHLFHLLWIKDPVLGFGLFFFLTFSLLIKMKK